MGSDGRTIWTSTGCDQPYVSACLRLSQWRSNRRSHGFDGKAWPSDTNGRVHGPAKAGASQIQSLCLRTDAIHAAPDVVRRCDARGKLILRNALEHVHNVGDVPHVDAGRGVAAVLLKQILSDFLLGCLGVVGDERFGRDGNIAVPEARPLRLQESPYTTFLVKRFDRTRHGRRLAFVSAMTLTQHKDGEPGASYLELVDLLQSRGADTAVDCEQLFRRVLFNVLIHNTDDHLRNHGFFIGEQGIRLSPAYDMNPSIDREALTLAINEVETACDVAIAMDAYRDYGLTTQQADRALQRVQTAIHSWRSEASRLHIPHAEQDLMAAAFEP